MAIETQTKPREYKIFVGTPYLTEGIEDYKCPKELLEQVVHFGYDPFQNFSGVEFLKTDKNNIVRLLFPNRDYETRRPNAAELSKCDLMIVGSTEKVEDYILSLDGSGIVVARYSIFYGNKSKYTGRTPEESGYSIDLPKAPGCALEFMTSDKTLEAISSRDELRIKSAIADLNKGHEKNSVLITPYLSEALRVQRNRGGFLQ